MSSSGKGIYPRYGNGTDGYILQSDFVVTIQRGSSAPVTGRVVELFDDRQPSSPTFGMTVASVEPIVAFSELNAELQSYCIKSGYVHGVGCQLFLVEQPKYVPFPTYNSSY